MGEVAGRHGQAGRTTSEQGAALRSPWGGASCLVEAVGVVPGPWQQLSGFTPEAACRLRRARERGPQAGGSAVPSG